ncbi:MAG: hypothetical protein AAFQ98_04525 [Bacteroidota bacterium]
MKHINKRNLWSLPGVVLGVCILTSCSTDIVPCIEPSGEPYLSIQLLDNTQEVDSVVAFLNDELSPITYLPEADTAIGISMNHSRMELTVYHTRGLTSLTLNYDVTAVLDEACGIHYLGLENVRVRMEGPLSFTDFFNPFDPAVRSYRNDIEIFLFP